MGKICISANGSHRFFKTEDSQAFRVHARLLELANQKKFFGWLQGCEGNTTRFSCPLACMGKEPPSQGIGHEPFGDSIDTIWDCYSGSFQLIPCISRTSKKVEKKVGRLAAKERQMGGDQRSEHGTTSGWKTTQTQKTKNIQTKCVAHGEVTHGHLGPNGILINPQISR